MKEEIAAAVFFLTRLAKRYGSLQDHRRDGFAAALTQVLFETYKNHWDPTSPSRGQAYRCLRMNRLQLRDPVLQLACVRSTVRYEDLGLPWELTLWVDPGDVSCRYGERSSPFCVTLVDAGRRRDKEFSRRIQQAVERAGRDVPPEESSNEEEEEDEDEGWGGDTTVSSSQSALCPAPDPPTNPEPKTIPTVSNPNSVYQCVSQVGDVSQTWMSHQKRKGPDGFTPHSLLPAAPPGGQKAFKPYRASLGFGGPRVDRYHWVSKTRS